MLRQTLRAARPLANKGKHAPARGMATEKQLKERIKSVTNIEKITKAMKMVSAAKLRGAQTNLDVARVFVQGVNGIWNAKEPENHTGKTLFVPMSSDRGLCGAINSSIVRGLRDKIRSLPADTEAEDIMIISYGDKGKMGLERLFGKHFVATYSELAKASRINFGSTCTAAQALLDAEYDQGYIAYQKFRNMLAYDTTYVPIVPYAKAIEDTTALEAFELEGEGELLQNFYEFKLAAEMLYYFREGETSELSARMNAMGNSSKNAGEMLEALQLLYNRNRQARITTELIEIISGAVALDEQ